MDVVHAVPARLSASPDGSLAEPDGTKSAVTGTPNGIRSSPPTLSRDVAMNTYLRNGSLEDSGGKSDSEAETIVLPGKDGHSPSKVRKSIKHEDKSEGEDEEIEDVSADHGANTNVVRGGGLEESGRGTGRGIGTGTGTRTKAKSSESNSSTTATSTLGKRKRSKKHLHADDSLPPGNSSGLSSGPTSPVATTRSSLSKPVGSDSEVSRSPSPQPRARSAIRDKAKSVDRVLSRRKQYRSGSGDGDGEGDGDGDGDRDRDEDEDEDEDEADSHRFRRQRSSAADHRSSRDVGSSSKLHADSNPRKRTRSISPQSRGHKRSISTTQLPSKPSHGLSHKKKRIPAPLQSTEYHSDESSASGTSHPRSSRVRHLAAPVTGEPTVSPARMAHKKHVNASGQTPLAIAVQRGLLDMAKLRYEERQSDLNLADNALNTPLHVASLNGFTDIVRFLLDTGNCELDSVNVDKDTPLHDAVDNGHLEVVKLLLDAGANPSKANKAGNEPLDIVNEKGDDEDDEDTETWAEMRDAILAAKRALNTDHRRGSEDHHMHDSESRMSNSKESPRQTPPIQNTDSQNLGLTNRKIGNVRLMNRTKDTTLYQPLDLNNLRAAARDGDAGTVSRILEIMPNVDDAQTLYNAARGGHEAVVNLLFALGNFDPDPPALDGLPLEQATPILAAIGKDNHLEVIKLLLGMPRFNPTRGFKDETYSQIAKRRAGPKWQEEEQLFKEAFDEYRRTHRGANKPRSPGLRRDGREPDREVRRAVRKDEQQPPRSHQRSNSNPKAKEAESSKTLHKSSSSTSQLKEGQTPLKRGPGRPKKEEITSLGATSDPETSPLGPPRQKSQSKRSESDVAVASESEPAAKPRRKLVSGKEFRGERELERKRRASVASNTSSISLKDGRDRTVPDTKIENTDGRSGPNISRMSKTQSSSHSERDLTSDKQNSDKDRARSLKRDDSKDRISAIRGESPVKRPRKSETPPRSNLQEVYPQKRRKLDGDSSGHKADSTPSSSPEIRSAIPKSTKSSVSRENTTSKNSSDVKPKKARSLETEKSKDSLMADKSSADRHTKSSNTTSTSSSDHTSKNSKSSTDRTPKAYPDEQMASAKAEEEGQRLAKIRCEKMEAEAEALKQKELDEKRVEEEARQVRQKQLEEEKQREELQKAREREIEEEKARERAEAEKIKVAARQAREAREQAAREDEEKRQREEAERKEKQRIEDLEAQNRAEEARRVLYAEQKRKEQEDLERRHREQVKQQRADRAKIEREKREERLAKLPLLLRWFDTETDPKTADLAKLFKNITGYRYDTIRPETTGHSSGREQWMLNYHVAILLGEKDLQLSRYTAWERVALTHDQKRAVWNTENGWILLANGGLPALRKLLPRNGQSNVEISDKNKALFLDLEIFFVKVSEFMFVVPNFPHLRNVEMQVDYQELRIPQMPGQLGQPFNQQKWRNDPDYTPGQSWAPRPKYFLNGLETRQECVPMTALLKSPPPVDRWPRREGITRVYPNEPDYEEICRKQGLYHLIPGYQASPVSSTNPRLMDSNNHLERVNGITPPRSEKSRSINGGSPPIGFPPEASSNPQLSNGTSGHESPQSALV